MPLSALKQLDAISDICTFQDSLLVATYNRTLEVYKGTDLQNETTLPFSLTKICPFKENILGISRAHGLLVVLNQSLEVIHAVTGLGGISMIHTNGELVVLGTFDGEIIILRQGDLHNSNSTRNNTNTTSNNTNTTSNINKLKIYNRKHFFTQITTLSSSSHGIAVGFQATLTLFDEQFNELFSKNYHGNISAITFCKDGLILGLINGKIHFEQFPNGEESFAFNSHASVEGDTKILYPVTQVEFDDFLFSSGYDGRVIKWDLARKRHVSTVASVDGFVRKFLISAGQMYCLVEEDPIEATGGAILYGTPI